MLKQLPQISGTWVQIEEAMCLAVSRLFKKIMNLNVLIQEKQINLIL